MCGLIGYVSKALPAEYLGPLRQSMVNRGPDGEGEYHWGPLSIGMRRLSVIDLEGGAQPLFSRDGRIVTFQNGEIYNYRELRSELETRGYAFKTHSDTEVIAHGYDARSVDGLLQRLDGMYAIAIHDQDSNELHLARDRLVKSLCSIRLAPMAFHSAPRCWRSARCLGCPTASICSRSIAISRCISLPAGARSCATSSVCCRASA